MTELDALHPLTSLAILLQHSWMTFSVKDCYAKETITSYLNVYFHPKKVFWMQLKWIGCYLDWCDLEHTDIDTKVYMPVCIEKYLAFLTFSDIGANGNDQEVMNISFSFCFDVPSNQEFCFVKYMKATSNNDLKIESVDTALSCVHLR